MIKKPTTNNPIVPISSRVVYENKWMKVREDKTLRKAGEGIYGVVETNDSVVICAIDSDKRMYLINAYSYPADQWSWQVPGGGGDGETPATAAGRELAEETGFVAARMENLGSFIVSCGLLKERMSVIVATDLKKSERPFSDDRDSIKEGRFFSRQEISDMIDEGSICDSQSISAIYLAERWLDKNGN